MAKTSSNNELMNFLTWNEIVTKHGLQLPINNIEDFTAFNQRITNEVPLHDDIVSIIINVTCDHIKILLQKLHIKKFFLGLAL